MPIADKKSEFLCQTNQVRNVSDNVTNVTNSVFHAAESVILFFPKFS